MNGPTRPRRNRKNSVIRDLIAETDLKTEQLIYPLFVCEGRGVREPIATMPGIFRMSSDELYKEIQECVELGLRSFALFPKIDEAKKDSTGVEACNPAGLVPKVISSLKDKFPDIALFTDIALDPYSLDGHDGIVRDGKILNDETVAVLCEMAVMHAKAGADFVAPSDMMDGRVGAIRKALDKSGFIETGILSYTAKYASSFYGPFREALDSAPRFGDKKTYQMDFRNSREALREAQLDIQEGADIIMVKPALSYLDVIHLLKSELKVPVAAYNVSGEYAMIKFSHQFGMNPSQLMWEVLLSIRRAGADIILTYFAKEVAQLLSKRS